VPVQSAQNKDYNLLPLKRVRSAAEFKSSSELPFEYFMDAKKFLLQAMVAILLTNKGIFIAFPLCY
jgi:hypothetical protein